MLPPDFVSATNNGEKSADLPGILITLMEIYKEKYNECYTLRDPAPNTAWGVKTSNGSFNGMIGMAERGEVDMVLNILSITYDRYKAVDVTVPMFESHTAIFKYPGIESDILGITRPYSLGVWISIIIGLFVIMIACYLIFKLMDKFHHKRSINVKTAENRLSDEKIQFSSLLLWFLAVFLSQSVGRSSSTKKYNPANLKVISALWFLSCFIFINVYKSNLIAMLTAPKISLPFTNFNEMVEQNELPLKVLDQSMILNLAENAEAGSQWRKFNSIATKPHYTSHDAMNWVGLLRRDIISGEFAFVALSRGFMTMVSFLYLQFGECKATLIEEPFLQVMAGIVLKKNSPVTAKLNKIIVGLTESGILQYWMKIYDSQGESCLHPTVKLSEGIRVLKMSDFYGVFCILLIGYVLSTVIFIIEYLSDKMKKDKIIKEGA